MNEKDKAEQLQKAGFKEDELTPEQEVEVFFPEPQKVIVGGKTYELKPLTLGNLKTLFRLSKIDISKISIETIDSLIDGIASILGEADKDFLEKHLDVLLVKNIFLKIRASTHAGIPQEKKGAQTRQPAEGVGSKV